VYKYAEIVSFADVPPFSFIVDNNDAEQKKFEDLTEKEKPHLVTVIFTITDRKKLEVNIMYTGI